MGLSSNIWNKTTEDMYTNFYADASIFKVTRYDIGFWGPYVDLALGRMNTNAVNDTKLNRIIPGLSTSDSINTDIKTKGYNSWLTSFYEPHSKGKNENNKTNGTLRMRWACFKITIPTVKAQFEENFCIDTVKPITYPLIKSYGGSRDVTLTVVEDRHMNWFQFFNALQNEFYTQLELLPRSSFQKCGMWIAVAQESTVGPNAYGALGGHTQDNNNELTKNPRAQDIDLLPVQVFEFNSAVIENISDLTYTNQHDAKHMTFDVTFKVPNTFQETYSDTLRGLLNHTNPNGNKRSRGYGNGTEFNGYGVDQSALDSNGLWKPGFWNYSYNPVIQTDF